MNMRGHFFTGRGTEHWGRLPREAGESCPLEIFKPCLDNVLWVIQLSRGVGPEGLQSPFQPQPFTDMAMQNTWNLQTRH